MNEGLIIIISVVVFLVLIFSLGIYIGTKDGLPNPKDMPKGSLDNDRYIQFIQSGNSGCGN